MKGEFQDIVGYAFVFGFMFLAGLAVLGGWFNTGVTTAQAQSDPKMQLMLVLAIPILIAMLIYGWSRRLEPGIA